MSSSRSDVPPITCSCDTAADPSGIRQRSREMSDQTHVIIGASLAGASSAVALRKEGFDGRIVLIGDEPDLPYERPELSKKYLRGELDDVPRVKPASFYETADVDLRTGTAVTG